MKVYGITLNQGEIAKWLSLKAHVLGTTNVQLRAFKTSRDFITFAVGLYDLQVRLDTPFTEAIDRLQAAIEAIPKSTRKKLRKANIVKFAGIIPADGRFLRRALAKQNGTRYFRDPQRAEKRAERRAATLAERSKPQPQPKAVKVRSPTGNSKKEFYKSWEWRTLRMQVIKLHGPACMCCGARTGDTTIAGEPVRICVDHIHPLATHWNLRLDPKNLQILCDECNQGKGAWDETDWRIPDNDEIPAELRDQLRYSI